MMPLLRWLALVGLFGSALGLRLYRIDDQFEHRRHASDVRDLIQSPGRAQMRALSMQHPLALADLFWLSCVQELGRFVEKHEPRVIRLKTWAQLATDLDPRYHQAYYVVAINLTVYNKDAEGSDRLLEKGRKNLPHKWQYPFMLGYNAYFLEGDLRKASRLWTEAAYMPGAPRFVPSLAARSRFQAGDEKQAEALLLTMIDHLSGRHKEDAIIRLKILRSEPILRAYDEACRTYFEQNGTLPASADELRLVGLVSHPARDLFGEPITLDENCRARTEIIFVREDEAKQRAGSKGKKAGNPGANNEESPDGNLKSQVTPAARGDGHGQSN